MASAEDKFNARKKSRQRTLSATEAMGINTLPTASGRVGQLLKLLNHGDAMIRDGAVKSLVRLGGKEAEAGLVYCLEDGDPQVRASVYKGLGKLRVRSALDHLAARLDDYDEICRLAAAAGLGQMGDYQGLDLVIGYLRANHALCWEAVRCLNLIVKQKFPANPRGLEEALTWINANKKKFKKRKLLPL